MFTKEQMTQLVSLLITLVAAHALNRQLTNSKESFLTATWRNSSIGIIVGVVVNMQLTPLLLQWLQKVGNYSEKRMTLIADIVNTIVLLTCQRVTITLIAGKQAELSKKWMSTVLTLVAGITLFNVVLRPVLSSMDPLLIAIAKKIVVYTSADYIAQGNNDGYDQNSSTLSMSSGVVLGELSATPIADAIANNVSL